MEEELAALAAITGAADADRRAQYNLGVVRLATTHTPRTVILPTGKGVRHSPNLTALLAMLLVRFGVPVLLHGVADDSPPRGNAGGDVRNTRRDAVRTADVLSRLGVRAAASPAQVQADLVRHHIAYTTSNILAPGLGTIGSAQPAWSRELGARLIDPFSGASYCVVNVDSRSSLASMRALLAAAHVDALLLTGCEGEPHTDPCRQEQLEDFSHGIAVIVTSSADDAERSPALLPAPSQASATAEWTSRVLAGELPIPASILTQLSCCLAGARRPRLDR